MAPARPPRDGSVRIANIPWLARMIDKARLDAAGQIDEFDLEYPCPMDQGLLRQFHMTGEEFQAIATQCQTDEEIIEALKQRNAILT